MTTDDDAANEPVAEEAPDLPALGGMDLGGMDLAALLGGAEGADNPFGGIMEMAQQMLGGAHAQAASTLVEGIAGGGAVKITATAGLEFSKVEIRKDAVDPDDVEMLEDLVLAALRDLVSQANEVTASAMGFGDLLGGFGPAPDGA